MSNMYGRRPPSWPFMPVGWAGDLSDVDRVDIEYQARPNARRDPKGQPLGWLPHIWVNGQRSGDDWASAGTDLETARKSARERAEREAARYVGDWRITIRERT